MKLYKIIFLLALTCHSVGHCFEQRDVEMEQEKKLQIIEVGEPVLREQARLLTNDEILSQEIQDLIQAMKAEMYAAPGVGLAAPQIGLPLQLIVIEDKAEYHIQWTPEQLKERERVAIPFHVIINPVLYIEEKEKAEFFEGCLSVPNFVGVVPRAKAVRVECLNEHAQPIVIYAKGWYARILQHEVDHLKGILYIDRVRSRTLMTQANFIRLWKEKSVDEARSVLDTL